MLNPSFSQEELDKIKTQLKSGIQTQRNDPDAIAANVRGAVLFGKDHPYGEIQTEESIDNITLEKCKAYFNTYSGPTSPISPWLVISM